MVNMFSSRFACCVFVEKLEVQIRELQDSNDSKSRMLTAMKLQIDRLNNDKEGLRSYCYSTNGCTVGCCCSVISLFSSTSHAVGMFSGIG